MQHCMAALQAGKHAVSTKPMDVSVANCRQAIAMANASGKLLAIDFQMRYEDKHLLIRKAVKDGLFGKLVLGEARLKWFRTQEYYDQGGVARNVEDGRRRSTCQPDGALHRPAALEPGDATPGMGSLRHHDTQD